MAKRAVDVTKLKRLFRRLCRAHGKPPVPEPTDPTDEMVLSLLLSGTTEQRAAAALRRLKRSFVDYNEVRVTRLSEIQEAVSPIPDAAEKAGRISRVLNAVYERFHRASLDPLAELSKREARHFLEAAGDPAAVARVLLLSLSGHAVPADDAVLRVLGEEGVVDEGTAAVKVQAALERHLHAPEAYAFYRLVRNRAEATAPAHPKRARRRAAAPRRAAARKKTAGKRKARPAPKRTKTKPARRKTSKKTPKKATKRASKKKTRKPAAGARGRKRPKTARKTSRRKKATRRR
jgi:endonuclease III